MEHSDIEHMAQGFPPSNIGKDHEEVVTELAKHALELQQKLDAVLMEHKLMDRAIGAIADAHATGIDELLAKEIDAAVNIETPATDALLNAVRAEAIEQAAEKAPWLYGDQMGRSVEAIPKEQLIRWAAQLRAETDTTHSQYESLAGGK